MIDITAGGIVSSYSFLAKDAPKYLPGYGICIAFTCLSILASVGYFVGVSREMNKRVVESSAGSETDEKISFEFTYMS